MSDQALDILQALAEGKRGAVARSNEVALYIVAAAHSGVGKDELELLVSALASENTVIVAHASHALLTVFKNSPELLRPYCEQLYQIFLAAEQWELIEQLAKILPHLKLPEPELSRLVAQLERLLRGSKSSIARTCALQSIVEVADLVPQFESQAKSALLFALEHGSKAMQARARNLMND